MDKKQLKSLINNYKKEISSGDLRNMDNLIAALVINDLTYLNDSILVKYGISNISLALLLGVKKDKKYNIPSKYEINDLKNNYERNRKINNYVSLEEVAATTWIDIMLSCGKISENEKIIPSEYILDDYVTDYKLSQLLPIEYKKSAGASIERIAAGKGMYKSNEDIVRISEGYGIPRKKDSKFKYLDLKKK